MTINISINDTRNKIAGIINDSGLPMGVVLYLLKDILEEVKCEANRQLANEIESEKKQIERKTDEHNEYAEN